MHGLGNGLGLSPRRQPVGSSPTPPEIPAFGMRSDGTLNYYICRDTVPNRAPITMRVWTQRVVDRNTFSTYMALNISGNQAVYPGVVNDGETLTIYLGNEGSDSTDTTLADNLWHQIHITYDGETAKLYVDRELVHEAEMTQNQEEVTSLTFLGDEAGEWWNGAVIGGAVWERVLSAEEISADGARLTPIAEGVWGWWLMSSVDDIEDRSGNGNHLTREGTPVPIAGPGIPL